MQRFQSLARSTPFLTLATLAICTGGLIPAVTARHPTYDLNWVSAYLVLVCGVSTIGLVAGRVWLSRRLPSGARLSGELILWFVGNSAVILGALSDRPAIVDVGSAILVASLLFVVVGVLRRTTGEGAEAPAERPPAPPWMRWLFATLVVILLISIPIGSLLSHRAA